MEIRLPKWLKLNVEQQVIEQKQEPRQSIMTSIVEQTNYRIKADIKKWRDALSMAESIEYKDLIPLLNIYREVDLDVNISALIDLKKDRIQQFEFHILDENDVEQETTDIFRQKWFYDFVDNYVDAMFWGFSILQINSIVDNKVDLELIPREYIHDPKEREFVKTLYGTEYISYDKPEYTDWLIEIVMGIGDYNKLAPIQIWKKSALKNWAQFQEVYGQPIRVGKTNSYRPEDRARFEKFLKDMGSNSYAVFDENMNIEFIQAQGTDAYNTYNEMIKMLDSEIAKLIIGGSMVNSDGSSYSQSQTHAEQADIKTRSDLRNIEFFVNDELIPLLNKHGMNIVGKFEFEMEADRAKEILVDKEIMDRFEVDMNWVSEKYDIPVIGMKQIQSPFGQQPMDQQPLPEEEIPEQ